MVKIVVTARELLDESNWADFCDDRGIDPYAIKEGLIDDDDEFTLSLKEAKKYGLVGFRQSEEDEEEEERPLNTYLP